MQQPAANSTATDVSSPGALVHQINEAAAAVGLDPGDYETMRVGTNIVLCDRVKAVVARVTPENTDPSEMQQWFQLVQGLANSGAPVLSPIGQHAIPIHKGRYVTFWPLADLLSDLPSEDFATLLSSFHTTDLPDRSPRWSYLERCASRMSLLSGSTMPSHMVDEIRNLVNRELVSLDFHDSSDGVLVHGDAHPSNVIRYRERLLLIDLDNVGLGPREIDLAPYAVSCRRFPDPSKSWEDFLGIYPFMINFDLLDRLARIREVTMIVWLASLWDTRPDGRNELVHRLRTLDQAVQWKAM